jgi:hypothetical protein
MTNLTVNFPFVEAKSGFLVKDDRPHTCFTTSYSREFNNITLKEYKWHPSEEMGGYEILAG